MSEEKTKKMMEEFGISLSVKEAADRVLMVLCAMTGGNDQIAISKTDLMAECKRLSILRMSQAEFNAYTESVCEMLKARNN